jgi:hypothetical protein
MGGKYLKGLKGIGQGVDWIHVTQGMVPWRTNGEHGNELSVSIEGVEFLDQFRNYQLLEKGLCSIELREVNSKIRYTDASALPRMFPLADTFHLRQKFNASTDRIIVREKQFEI